MHRLILLSVISLVIVFSGYFRYPVSNNLTGNTVKSLIGLTEMSRYDHGYGGASSLQPSPDAIDPAVLEIGSMEKDVKRIRQAYDGVSQLDMNMTLDRVDVSMQDAVLNLIKMAVNYNDTVERVATYADKAYSAFGNPFGNGFGGGFYGGKHGMKGMKGMYRDHGRHMGFDDFDEREMNFGGGLQCMACSRDVKDAVHTGCKDGRDHSFIPREIAGELRRYEEEKKRLGAEEATLQSQVDDLTRRCAKEMNISESDMDQKMKPVGVTDLKKAYENLCSREWAAAKKAITKYSKSEDTALILLSEILVAASRIPRHVCKEFKNDIRNMILNPSGDGHATTTQVRPKAGAGAAKFQEPAGLNGEAERALEDFLRAASDTLNIGALTQEVANTVMALDKYNRPTSHGDLYQKCKGMAEMKTFVEESVKLAWKMSLQEVSMKFSVADIGQKFNKHSHKQYDPNGRGTTIKYYVYPSITQGQDVVFPGTVVTG